MEADKSLLANRRDGRKAHRKVRQEIGALRADYKRSRAAKVSALVSGGLIYGLAEGAGDHLWQPVFAVAGNLWAWPLITAAAGLALVLTRGGQAMISPILRSLLTKLWR